MKNRASRTRSKRTVSRIVQRAEESPLFALASIAFVAFAATIAPPPASNPKEGSYGR